MMTCRELAELVTAYLDGSMPAGERLRFQLHLALCSNCRAHLDQMRRTIEATGRVPDLETTAPEPVQEELLAHFRNWKSPR
jgi:anti-sigma factor RsiW